MWPKNSPRRHAPARLGLERLGRGLAQRAGGDQRVGAAVDEREDVARVLVLDVAVAAQPHDLPARAAHERAEAAHEVAIVHERRHRGIGARLQRVVVAQGDGGRRVVAVEDGQRAAGGGHPRRLGQRRRGVGDVREHGVEDDRVERGGLDGHGSGTALPSRGQRYAVIFHTVLSHIPEAGAALAEAAR